jgi:prepilin-type N-terminal cleavage/methylation domain-containing protein
VRVSSNGKTVCFSGISSTGRRPVSRKSCRCGFTLVEVLIVLSLMGVFTTLAYRLLVANLRLTASVMDANNNSARLDDAVRLLRADVADSTSVEMPAAGVLRVHVAGEVVEWRSDHDVLTRKTAPRERRWNVGTAVNLKMDGAVVLLVSGTAQPVAMASMHRSSTGGRP